MFVEDSPCEPNCDLETSLEGEGLGEQFFASDQPLACREK
jgi:hypothetical protein